MLAPLQVMLRVRALRAGRRPGLLALTTLLACQAAPDNSPRFWDGRSVVAQADAGGGPRGTGGTGGTPSSQGSLGGNYGGGGSVGYGGFAVGRNGGSGGQSGGSGTGGTGGSGYGQGGYPGTPDAYSYPPSFVFDAGPREEPGVAASGPRAGCSMKVTLSTVTMNGDWSPKNCGAIWVTDNAGKFVKTLEVWAARRVHYLDKWTVESGAANQERNTADAVTAATLRTHGAHTSTWNCTDVGGKTMPTGQYRLCMELNENSSDSLAYQCLSIQHSGESWKLSPPDAIPFKGRNIEYAPK